MKNLNPFSKRTLNVLSFVVIIATGVLEFYYPNTAAIRFGYLIGVTLTVASDHKRLAIWATLLSVLFITIAFIFNHDQEAIKVLLVSRVYIVIGLSITALLVLIAIQRKVKADEYRSQMAGIFANGTQGIILTNQVGDIVLVNPYTERLFGFTSKELIGSKIGILLPEAEYDGLTNNKNEYSLRKDLVAHRKDRNDFPVEVSLNQYISAEKTYIVTFVTDISFRKRNEEILKEKQEELEVANRELEAFSYSVSHDLRSPLRIIGGYAQMLEEDYGTALDANGKKFLVNIQHSAERMGTLIDDLLAFSRLGRKEIIKNKVDMTQVVQFCLDEINQGTTHRAQIEIMSLHPVSGDASLLTRVMTNLLSNAIKYSSKIETPHIWVTSTVENNKVIFCVRDNGAGFDMRYVHKLFGVFQRLHSDKEFYGTGVGLAIARRIIHKHGGEIWAEGEEGVGASFYFSLPWRQEDTPVKPAEETVLINNQRSLARI